jgi:hypothetical protein
VTESKNAPLQFTGSVTVQFHTFFQQNMETDAEGNDVFVGVARGYFGTPPRGTEFDAFVKLTVGAKFTENAYEVIVDPALARLVAHPEFRWAAYDFVDRCMVRLAGPNWQRLTGVTAQSNLIQAPGPFVTIDFAASSDAW